MARARALRSSTPPTRPTSAIRTSSIPARSSRFPRNSPGRIAEIAARGDSDVLPEHLCEGARAVVAAVEGDGGYRLAAREMLERGEEPGAAEPRGEAHSELALGEAS